MGKKVYIVFILAVLASVLYRQAGYIMIYDLKLEAAKESSWRQLKSQTSLQRLSVPRILENTDKFIKEEEGEIRYEGKMYDYVSETIKGDSIIYYCLEDKAESEAEEILAFGLTHNTQLDAKNGADHSKIQLTDVPLDFIISRAFFYSYYPNCPELLWHRMSETIISPTHPTLIPPPPESKLS